MYPVQASLGETWDISPLYQFVFWQKVSYTNPGVTFPKDKHHPGRWLGVSPNVGDLLTYRIEPDHKHYGRHVELHRSAVHADDGNNMKLNEVRRPDDDTPRTGVIWKESVEEEIDDQDDLIPELVPRASGEMPSTVVRFPTEDQEHVYGTAVGEAPEEQAVSAELNNNPEFVYCSEELSATEENEEDDEDSVPPLAECENYISDDESDDEDDESLPSLSGPGGDDDDSMPPLAPGYADDSSVESNYDDEDWKDD